LGNKESVKDKIISLNKSTVRLSEFIELPVKDKTWNRVFRKEVWINFRRSFRVWWAVIVRRER
jgi:hypothetical protein